MRSSSASLRKLTYVPMPDCEGLQRVVHRADPRPVGAEQICRRRYGGNVEDPLRSERLPPTTVASSSTSW